MKKKAARKSPTPRKAAAKSKGHPEGGKLSVIPAVPLFDRVATILDAARSSVVRAVNSRMVLAYWLIGREIVQDLQGGDERAAYGKRVLQTLSQQLTQRYGAGYSLTSLKDFKLLYTTYPDRLEPISLGAHGIVEPASSLCGPISRPLGGFLPPSSPSGGKSHPPGGFFEILDALGRESETSGKAPCYRAGRRC